MFSQGRGPVCHGLVFFHKCAGTRLSWEPVCHVYHNLASLGCDGGGNKYDGGHGCNGGDADDDLNGGDDGDDGGGDGGDDDDAGNERINDLLR